MRLLACDFDGTIFCRHTISQDDLAAIRLWRERGNLFGIVTGRGFMTLAKELVRHPLEWDFLLCNNGALLLDADAQVAASRPLDQETASALLASAGEIGCDSLAVFSGTDMHLIEGWGPWINPVYTPPFISMEEALQDEAVQISYGFCQRERAFEVGESLALAFRDRVSVQCSLSVADMTACGVGKASGIAWACQVNGWEPEGVLAVGDDGNDVDMLAAYQGYAMEGADEYVRNAASGTVKSVAQLVSTMYDTL